MRGPSEALHEGAALGRGGRGKGATPQPIAGPRGRDRHAAPPPGRQEASPGDHRAPPTPPPPSHSGPRAGGGWPPHPPHPPQLGSHRRGPPPPRSRGDAPPPKGTATRWGEQRLDLLPRAHTSVPEQRAQQNNMEATPHMTLP